MPDPPAQGLPADGGEHRGGEALSPEVLRHRHALDHILLEGGGGGQAALPVPEKDGVGHIPLPGEALTGQKRLRLCQGPAPKGAVLLFIVSVRHSSSFPPRWGGVVFCHHITAAAAAQEAHPRHRPGVLAPRSCFCQRFPI